MNRRDFVKSSALLGVAGIASPKASAGRKTSGFKPAPALEHAPAGAVAPALPHLEPAHWIWYPSERCLPNTFVLFRRELTLAARPRRAQGWIAADSRYLLEVNGRRVQWGPAPADPRWPEADPMDLTELLEPGQNVLGATVLFYGHGDGTWPIGKPGFLFWLELEHADGRIERVSSDASWQVHLARAWLPGRPKRWYLRALQEEFDARLYPHGWGRSDFARSDRFQWLPAMELQGAANRPALSTSYYEYTLDVGGGPADARLRPRSIPLMREESVAARGLVESYHLDWVVAPRDYFDFRVPDACTADRRTPAARASGDGRWAVELDGVRGAVLTFEWPEQIVGWPGFTIEAPAGTSVELLVHEAHKPGTAALMNTHFDSWTRFICREGINRFQTFDFESLRWLQLHLHGARGGVVVSDVAVRRRQFPWPHEPELRVAEPALQRLMDASVNTLHNCAQETLVDGMARERQQYSGDGSHQMHAVYLAFGENRLPARFVTTFSQGLTKDGYFLDCWPAYDRLARLVERQLDLSGWGPILDHGVGFNFDCWHHYLYTGDLGPIREAYPRLLRFAEYLRSLVDQDGLLPVENLGIPSVWIDHVAYQRQRHKQCAFNLYAAAMFQHALSTLAQALGDPDNAQAASAFGSAMQAAVVKRYWSREHGLFVNNLPWLREEQQVRLCDRSLATAVLFDQCPKRATAAAIRALAECPAEMGFSYPCNAGWRLWALGKGGRADVMVKDLRTRWATMASVLENNTLQEDWEARHDSGQQWSHCAVAPIYIMFHSVMGLRPLEPGFKRLELRPQLADLPALSLTAQTVQGPVRFVAEGAQGQRNIRISIPAGCEAELVVRREEAVTLEPVPDAAPAGHLRYRLPGGAETALRLTHT